MSYSRFSTGNAEYWLNMGTGHDLMMYEPVFSEGRISSLDAIVIEDCGIGPIMLSDSDSENAVLVRAAKRNRVDIYLLDIIVREDIAKYVDFEHSAKVAGLVGAFLCAAAGSLLRHKKKLTRRRMIGLLGGALASAAVAATGFLPVSAVSSLQEQGVEASEFDMDVVSLETQLIQTEGITLRNAVNARKIEEYLAPMLRQNLGRKPRIALVYGPLHAGVKNYLQDKQARDSIIREFENVIAELKDNPVLERVLNTIHQYIPTESGHGFVAVEHKCDCF
ncbi:MAG: hypothetical protein KJ955_01610 [Nanoarchaeota archaeon]|nr:hypothetical protein [Nanoarchaeota archaeon]